MSNYTLEGIKISPDEFLGALFEANDKINFRVFADKPNAAFQGGINLSATQGYFDSIYETLLKHNIEERGIFYVVNYGGNSDADITRINAQFVENDDLPLKEQLAVIKAFPLEPSLIVRTQKSLHTYWLIKDGDVKKFRRIQRGLIAHFNADPKCENESRVFRLPGFHHYKHDPVMVEVIKFNPELRYTQKQLEVVLPEVPEDNPSTPTKPASTDRGNQLGIKTVGLRCHFIKYCNKNAKTLPEPLWYAMITNLAVFKNGNAAIHKLSKPYPKYSHEQTDKKILHFYKSKTKPMKCAKIAESGYECPNFKKGACKCKSPAGLSYYPLDMNTLRKRLDACKVTGVLVEDVITAREFIEDYLYNIEKTIGDAFITSEIKQRFSFKMLEVKKLTGLHREIYKKFYNSPEVKEERINGGEELPEWYEFTEQGKKFYPGILADHCAENADIFFCADEYHFYENGVYVKRKDSKAFNYIRKRMLSDKGRAAMQIKDAEFQWRIQIDKYAYEVNTNTYLVNFGNGIYNALTNEFLEHDPKILSTIRLGGNYDPDAQCPVFMDYINNALPETEIPLAQEIFGYLLVPINKAQKAFVMLGKSGSGKSTLLHTAQQIMLNPDNCVSLEWQKLNEKFATAELFGKLANVFADLPNEQIRSTGLFKAIVGEDYITAEHKYRSYFSFKPTARLLFSCEEMPKSYVDRTAGFYRRLIIMKFDNVIPHDKRDNHLWDKFAMEVDGITTWALAGLKRLIANDFRFSETDRTREELRRYMSDNSTALAFVDECCVLEQKAEIGRRELYNAYLEYCKESNIKHGLSTTRFNKDLDDIGLLRRTTAGIRTWRGIKLS